MNEDRSCQFNCFDFHIRIEFFQVCQVDIDGEFPLIWPSLLDPTQLSHHIRVTVMISTHKNTCNFGVQVVIPCVSVNGTWFLSEKESWPTHCANNSLTTIFYHLAPLVVVTNIASIINRDKNILKKALHSFAAAVTLHSWRPSNVYPYKTRMQHIRY